MLTVDSALPRFRRARSSKLLAGVAAGLAQHMRLDVLAVRVAFVLLTALGGFGLLLYGACWVVVPQQEVTGADAPGLAAAERAGLRPRRRMRFSMGDAGQLVAFGALAIGLGVLFQSSPFGVSAHLFWPALVVAFGAFLIWRQNDLSDDASVDGLGASAREQPGAWRRWIKIGVGGVLVAAGLSTFVVVASRRAVAADVVLGVGVTVVAVVLVGSPWLFRIVRELRDERTERALSQERADVAAHLHDSVLQTLALIQRQATDPREVIRLARSQERDLRGWLYGSGPAPDSSLRAALERVAAEVEEHHGVPVEVVVVGDSPVTPAVEALVRAAREALVNASVHSGADRVDVYAEVEGSTIAAFVRDRGSGFDPDLLPDGRMGVRGSILERMRRHGGTGEVRSVIGDGTEVRLQVTLNGNGQPAPPGSTAKVNQGS